MAEKITAKVQEVIILSETAKALRISLDKKIDFFPGQFVIAEFNLAEKGFEVFQDKSPIQKRAFSISSSPNAKLLELTVKKTENGFVSKYIVDHIDKNDALQISLPSGHFFFQPQKLNHILLLAAGSGIAPMMSIIRFLTESKSKLDYHLIYSNKFKSDILWKEEIESLSKKNKNFTYLFTLTQESWDGHKGRINEELISDYLKNKNPSDVDCYLCGPLDFVKTMQRILISQNIPRGNIKQEAYG